MPSGLVALLDDVASITKLAAASLDDIGAAAGKAGMKSAGVVVDDAAVTPRYVTGFSPDRELPIIYKIAKGSLKNKIVFLLPAAMLLSAFAPWAITPLLMLGGAYLCYEATEKIMEAVIGHDAHVADVPVGTSPFEMEQEKVSGAIRTDFILSAEIMAIALADVAESPLVTQGIVLAAVGIGITIIVYGAVGLIVKMDDIGLHLAQRRAAATRAIGRGLVLGMPLLMKALGIIGTAAMLWVGGGIVVHGADEFHLTPIPHLLHEGAEAAGHAVPAVGGAISWLVNAAGAAVVGLVIGGAVILALKLIQKLRGRPAH
jgi:predicted DNA repair protein MutK